MGGGGCTLLDAQDDEAIVERSIKPKVRFRLMMFDGSSNGFVVRFSYPPWRSARFLRLAPRGRERSRDRSEKEENKTRLSGLVGPDSFIHDPRALRAKTSTTSRSAFLS